MGLRTLAIAVRHLSAEDYHEISSQLDVARQALVDREKEVSRVCDIIESDMTLLGATGVEDQLQEGVPETLEALRAAGIKVNFIPFRQVKKKMIYSIGILKYDCRYGS